VKKYLQNLLTVWGNLTNSAVKYQRGNRVTKVETTSDTAIQNLGSAALTNARGTSPILLVCEHASRKIPLEFEGLGLTPDAQISHVAWDPGAFEMAAHMARILNAKLVTSTVSRLVYDCNRPPESPGAMPSKSEVFDIPGNQTLTDAQRADRVLRFYRPFQSLLSKTIAATETKPVLVTLHSFTPVYQGARRDVEIGILHDTDARLADQMLTIAAKHTPLNVQRNSPYGPQDGVTHTLKEHGIENGLMNVMIEVRNDLIATVAAQHAMGQMLADLITEAMQKTGAAA